jgi:hypothetical protein
MLGSMGMFTEALIPSIACKCYLSLLSSHARYRIFENLTRYNPETPHCDSLNRPIKPTTYPPGLKYFLAHEKIIQSIYTRIDLYP